MSEEQPEGQKDLEIEELERQNAEPLPDREAMSVIGDPANWTMPPVPVEPLE